MAETLNQCERDVELARSKLAQDLATLRSPATYSSFTNTLKHEVLDTKDAVVAQAQDAVQSRLTDFVEDLKAKAAANRVSEQLKEATVKAGEKLKNVVDEKGLNPTGLKDVASEVAGAFSGSMTGSGTGGSDKAAQTKLPGDYGYRG